MNWLKKGNLAAVAVILTLGTLLSYLFLDSILRWALVRGGQAAAGARVEIGSVRTRLLEGRLLLRHVAVADRSEPMKNLLEFEDAELSFLPSAALRGKIVIPEATLTGLRLGTPRSRSGALPRAKPSKLELLAREQLAPVQKALQSQAGDLKALPKELDVKKLDSLRSLDDAKARLQGLPERYKAQAELPKKIERELKEIQAGLQSLQGGGGSPADIAGKVRAVQKAQQRLKALQAEVSQAKNDLAAQFEDVNAGLRKAQDLKNKDLNGLLAEAGLPTLDADSLTKRLLGPAASKKVSNALYWLSWARRHSAEKKGAQPKPEQRRRGVDVEFPRPGAYPEFLLEHAAFTGSLSGLAGGKDLSISGSLTGVTSNPPLYGKPARLELGGAIAGGPPFTLTGQLDSTKPQAQAPSRSRPPACRWPAPRSETASWARSCRPGRRRPRGSSSSTASAGWARS